MGPGLLGWVLDALGCVGFRSRRFLGLLYRPRSLKSLRPFRPKPPPPPQNVESEVPRPRRRFRRSSRHWCAIETIDQSVVKHFLSQSVDINQHNQNSPTGATVIGFGARPSAPRLGLVGFLERSLNSSMRVFGGFSGFARARVVSWAVCKYLLGFCKVPGKGPGCPKASSPLRSRRCPPRRFRLSLWPCQRHCQQTGRTKTSAQAGAVERIRQRACQLPTKHAAKRISAHRESC